MPDISEQELAELIASLPAAPLGWVQAAQALPQARAAIETLVARAQANADEREAIVRDLDAALQAEGIEPRLDVVRELRGRLESGSL